MANQKDIDDVVSMANARGLSKREMCIAAMNLLDHAGISVDVQGQVADLLYDEIDDINDCELPGEVYDECCDRVALEEARLRDELTLKVEV